MTEKMEYKITIDLYSTDKHYLLEHLIPKIMKDTVESKCKYEIGQVMGRKVE